VINNKKVLALIPARGGSKGLPRKNVIDLCGRPLLGWPIQAAKGSRFIDRLIVSTDDREIAESAARQGAEVPFLRPPELATDTATSSAVIEHAISFLKTLGDQFDYLVFLEPTSPLTESEDIDRAIEKLDNARGIADSIVSVSRVEAAHPIFDVTIGENSLIMPYGSEKFFSAGRRQNISDLYFFDGSLYISDVDVYLDKKSFYHERTLSYIVPKWKAFEVDDIVDLICIEAIIRNLTKINKER
jgi:CMP-N,N'-diacetyllegionaminic acid synthase